MGAYTNQSKWNAAHTANATTATAATQGPKTAPTKTKISTHANRNANTGYPYHAPGTFR